MKRVRIVGLVILFLVVIAFALNIEIQRSSRAVPADYNSMKRIAVGLYHGDLGFWLSGDPVTTSITDWSFIDEVPNVQIETRTWYFLPHFVRTDIARSDAHLYLCSEYFAPEPGQPDLRDRFPEARFWNRMVFRDPRIRVKIENRLFEMRAYPITDSAQIATVRDAFLAKYADIRRQEAMPESRRPRMHFFRLEQGWKGSS